MKKKILLIRHSNPDFPSGKHLCLGRRSDPGLSEEGRRAAGLLLQNMKDILSLSGTIYASPLKRALETAVILSEADRRVIIETDLTEMDLGEWDGLDFDTIKAAYPKLYNRRKDDMSLVPPGAEEFHDASLRMRNALKKIALSTESDTLLIVSHSGIIRAFLCDLTGISYKDNRIIPLEYCSVKTILYDTEKDIFELKEA